ncbi:nuclease-related domain-containing protein [Beijerinckia sp. L45]|uniref:nuclease-related domain-containing protein n=1 Tax=Beijerinckia sp. L45 TaxID=1641855 RepID=UPI00131BEB7B|nr:nuclease-related domain-containing protein [Beijerinckia sp. L45]
MKPVRPEQEVFEELAALAAKPGFAHVVAFLSVRDNFVWFKEDMTAEDMGHLYSRSRVIRTEMSTLIGLMVRADPDYAAPPPIDLASVTRRVEALLSELHDALSRPWVETVGTAGAEGRESGAWLVGDAMREPIFYGGEGAFSFQTCEFATRKYAADHAWILANKGASINDMIAVARATASLATERLRAVASGGLTEMGDVRLLEAFSFTVAELAPYVDLPPATIGNCVLAFALPPGHRNPGFTRLHDFNAVNASPIVSAGDGRFLLFHFNALAEAIYESPFYWLCADKAYAQRALKHRGDFTETFALERLEAVFGPARVHRGVKIERGKGERLGEIDVLALFGDRAVVLQAKSKRLTLEARRGDDRQLKSDFKGAVQDAYDQAMDCAAALGNPRLRFVTADGRKLDLSEKPAQVFPICLVADHYPALAFQTGQFLVQRKEDGVLPPLIIDVFMLDVMAEMLHRPARFLSYMELRAIHGSKVHIHHEITLLSYHLKNNLWLDDEYDFVMLEDDFAADVEIAMGARRLGLPGRRTPAGILTALEGSRLDAMIESIEACPHGAMIDLVLLIYQLSGNSLKRLRDGVDEVLENARRHGSSDFGFGFSNTGITVHANSAPRIEAEDRLETHMMLRKYRQRVDTWYGLALSPADGSIRFGRKLAHAWRHDETMEMAAKLLK